MFRLRAEPKKSGNWKKFMQAPTRSQNLLNFGFFSRKIPALRARSPPETCLELSFSGSFDCWSAKNVRKLKKSKPA
jgi:hypothetical protein